jgi:hypothetical protein
VGGRLPRTMSNSQTIDQGLDGNSDPINSE